MQRVLYCILNGAEAADQNEGTLIEQSPKTHGFDEVLKLFSHLVSEVYKVPPT